MLVLCLVWRNYEKGNTMKKEKIIGNILFWLTLISPFVAFVLMGKIGEASIFGVSGIIRYAWIMWLFIPFGALSILIGIRLKRKSQKYKKNLIVALICLPLLIIFGSYGFIFNGISYDTEKVSEIENEIRLELPGQVKIATNEVGEYNVSYLKITDDEDKAKFEQELGDNVVWRDELSSKLKGLLPLDIQYEVEKFDRFVFYNKSLDEYNMYPVDGEHEVIFIAYDYEIGRFIILDSYKIALN